MDILSEQGTTYDECLARIREKYGPDIHVLRQKKVKMGGFLGFFEKDGIELFFMLSKNPYRPANIHNTASSNFNDERKRILQQAVKTAPSLASRIPEIHDEPSRMSETTRDAEQGKEQLETILNTVRKLEKRLDKTGSEEGDKTRGEEENFKKKKFFF